ncbi:MAG: calcium-binding protein [Gemmobacter sp.]
MFSNTTDLDSRTLDAIALSDGRVLFAFGGSASVDAVVYTATVDPLAGTLGAVTTQVIPRNAVGGFGVSTMRRVELDAAPGGKAVVTMHLVNTSIGDDANFALATQVYAGASPTGRPRAVNPGAAAEDTHDAFDTLVLRDGSYVTFHSSPGAGIVNLSNGIWMTRFNANGTVARGPVQVIDERIVSTLANLENNPEKPEAVLMRNGNIGLVYTEKDSRGRAVAVFQELTAGGAKVGDPVPLGFGLEPRLIVLESGRMLAVADQAQVLTAAGDKAGAAFALLPEGGGARTILDVVALGNGGFAVAWADNGSGLVHARMFDAKAKPLTNPFFLTDTIGDFALRGNLGLVAVGDDLMTYVSGNKTILTPVVIEAQMFDGAGSMGRVDKGTKGANTMGGTAADDILRGQAGRDVLTGKGANDLLYGGTGNDRLDGGDGEDDLFGDAGNDRLVGGGGLDNLFGGDGNDLLNGGAGRDRLVGGQGADVLTGGADADRFVFNAPAEGGDRITDFRPGEGDRIVLNLAAFLPGFLTVGATVNPAQFGLFFETTTRQLTFDADGSGSAPRLLVATLDGVDMLTTADLQFAYF